MAYCSSKKKKKKKKKRKKKERFKIRTQAYIPQRNSTYGAYEASPTPFATQSLDGLVVIPDRPFTPLAFRKP